MRGGNDVLVFFELRIGWMDGWMRVKKKKK